MAARICPYCRELNSVDEQRCFRCGRRLPNPATAGARRVVREFFGGEAPMTRVLLFLELAVFAVTVLADVRAGGGLAVGLGLPIGIPGLPEQFKASTLLRLGALAGPLGEREPWRLLASVFLHAGILHVGMNMYIFTSLGRQLEAAIGSARSTVLFLATGVLGFVASEFWYAPFQPLTVGASGAVFGQIGGIVGILAARSDPEWKRVFVRNLMYAVLLSLALGNVNTSAHLGGFAAGIAIGFGFGRERPSFRLEWPLRILAAAGILAVFVSVGLSMSSPVWQRQRAREVEYE